jgi:hypothetical protein
MQGDRLVSVNEVPRLDALHETLMREAANNFFTRVFYASA